MIPKEKIKRKLTVKDLAALKGAPLFRCELTEDKRQLVFWCPYCHKEHTHGAVHPAYVVAHRVRHCTGHDNFGYSDAIPGGYYVFHTDPTWKPRTPQSNDDPVTVQHKEHSTGFKIPPRTKE